MSGGALVETPMRNVSASGAMASDAAVFCALGAHPANKTRVAKEINRTGNLRMHHFIRILSFLLRA
jgi:hypothetical protein